MSEKMESFDLEQVYDEQIAPLMAKIIEICKEHKLPMAADFLCRNSDDEGEEYCTSFADFRDERGESKHMDAVWQVIKPKRNLAPLNLTVRNGSGDVTEMITILG